MNVHVLAALATGLKETANALEIAIEQMGGPSAPKPSASIAQQELFPAPEPHKAPDPAPEVQPMAQPTSTAAPVTEALTLAQTHVRLGEVASRLDEAGKTRLASLIHGYGVPNVSSMDPQHFPDLVEKAEALVNE